MLYFFLFGTVVNSDTTTSFLSFLTNSYYVLRFTLRPLGQLEVQKMMSNCTHMYMCVHNIIRLSIDGG